MKFEELKKAVGKSTKTWKNQYKDYTNIIDLPFTLTYEEWLERELSIFKSQLEELRAENKRLQLIAKIAEKIVEGKAISALTEDEVRERYELAHRYAKGGIEQAEGYRIAIKQFFPQLTKE